ncbi:MAG: FtsW/RodA/SpoVE family cell cycle protein [Bacilli bacterium]|nr:FtsW/RodA/SpoVE family cell cycle protein [Bacilli bacterium]
MLKKYKFDKFIIFSIIMFFIVSITSIYSAQMYLSPTLGNLALKQAFWYFIGFVIIFIIIKINNNFFYKYAWYIYLANCVLLLGLLFVAPDINGSKCWYIIKGIGSIQPSEFMKISLILMLAKTIDSFHKKHKKPKLKDELFLLIQTSIILGIPSILTFLEPDTGAVIIYFIITLLMLFISGIRPFWYMLLGIIIIAFLSGFLFVYFFQQDLFIKVFGSSFFYRIDRIINWKMGSGMQLENSLAAIGSSYLMGHGFNNTPIYFPESGTDFIFSVFASNFGLIGSLLLVLIVLLFDLRIINIGKYTINRIDKYITVGILGIFIYQQIQNIGMTIGILPITGITLPFISYGGSSLIAYMILIGIILNINNNKNKKIGY